MAAAGELLIDHGVIKMASDRSGHYMPRQKYTRQFRTRLKELLGPDFDKIIWDFEFSDP